LGPAGAIAGQKGGCKTFCGGGGVSVLPDDTGIGVHLGNGGSSGIPASGGGGGGGGGGGAGASGGRALTEYAYREACSQVCTLPEFTAGDAACSGRGGTYYYVDSRPVGATEWETGTEITCLTPDQLLAYDPAQLGAYVNEYFRRLPLPEPGLKVAPADNAVVNLPEIVSADEPQQTAWTIDVAPFPRVVLNASVQWEWTFGDGGAMTTSSPGRPFDQADPDVEHYLTHTYRKAGTYPLSVTAVWTATYTVEGEAGALAVDGAVERTSSLDLRAADYAGVLTGN